MYFMVLRLSFALHSSQKPFPACLCILTEFYWIKENSRTSTFKQAHKCWYTLAQYVGEPYMMQKKLQTESLVIYSFWQNHNIPKRLNAFKNSIYNHLCPLIFPECINFAIRFNIFYFGTSIATFLFSIGNSKFSSSIHCKMSVRLQ